jgi:hypothetical protein
MSKSTATPKQDTNDKAAAIPKGCVSSEAVAMLLSEFFGRVFACRAVLDSSFETVKRMENQILVYRDKLEELGALKKGFSPHGSDLITPRCNGGTEVLAEGLDAMLASLAKDMAEASDLLINKDTVGKCIPEFSSDFIHYEP